MRFRSISILTGLCCLALISKLQAQNSGVKSQYWNNLNVAWQISDNFFIGNTLSYNVLFDKELPWSELSYSATAVLRINSFLLGNGGMYIAATNQSTDLNSVEIRPYIGIRISSKLPKRWVVSNLTRIEWRNLIYSNDTNDLAFRLRNRTNAAISINRKSLLDDHTLSLFAYFEAFHNLDNTVTERYFTTLKYKAGLAYRFSLQWRIDLGILFNNSRNTIETPSQLPGNIVTNFILEWGLTYAIPNNN